MAQGGLHRGVAVCRSNPGPPVTQPSPGLVCDSLPQPMTPLFCTGTSWVGSASHPAPVRAWDATTVAA